MTTLFHILSFASNIDDHVPIGSVRSLTLPADLHCVVKIASYTENKDRNKYKKQLQKIGKKEGMEYQKAYKQG